MPDWTPNILRPGATNGEKSEESEESEVPDERDAARAVKVKRMIYSAPRAKANCALPAVDERRWSSKKRYLDKVASCLDKIWAREFREVDLPFTPPHRKYVRKRVKHPVCGLMPVKGAAGTYCDSIETYFIIDDPSFPSRPWKAWAADVSGHEYGHHLQYLTKILAKQTALLNAATTKKAEYLVSRRLELQADCLSGVALRAMRRRLPPTDEFAYLYSGTLAKKWSRTHGLQKTRYRWMQRGYKSGKPGSCDTWSSRASKVT
ncbi:neutral zinc metallopeptidase [Thermopolyspora sp. NPDC052614]|uniref:neutral zinc metallopeptidase n=1 Tax=Thermopolyspora sp. NPDC052614 TaxID=3155682 RepID=UPI0034371FE0